MAKLLEAFGVERLSDDVRERIAAALADVRIDVDPPLASVDPNELVRLALPDSDLVWAQETGGGDGSRRRLAIAGTEWRARAGFVELDLQRPRSEEGTVWFDVDPREVRSDQVLDELWPFCRNELTREMVEELLGLQARPGVRRYGPDGEVRLVSTFGMNARERASNQSSSKAGELVFRSVTVLAGSDWLVTCYEDDGDDFTTAIATAQKRLEGLAETPTPGDLAINVVYSVICTHPAAERRLHAWLDAWETEFHPLLEVGNREGLSKLEMDTLIDLRGLLADLRSRMHGFEQPWLDPADAWFADVRDRETATRVRQLVSGTLVELRQLEDALRMSLDLLTTATLGAQEAQGERLSRQLTFIAAAFILPSLIAELSGSAPVDDGEWLMFAVLVAGMLAAGALLYVLLKRVVR